jgi:hypothetical protein
LVGDHPVALEPNRHVPCVCRSVEQAGLYDHVDWQGCAGLGDIYCRAGGWRKDEVSQYVANCNGILSACEGVRPVDGGG